MPFLNSTDFQDNYEAVDVWTSTLSSAISNSVTIIPLASTSGLPAKGWVSIGSEHIFYSLIDGNSLGDGGSPCVRGVDGTSNVSHGSGDAVEQRINAVAFNTMLSAVKKRKSYTLACTQVAANTVSEQNIASYASRVLSHDFRIAAVGGSEQFKIELYRTDGFLGVDKIYESVELASIESAIDQSSASGQKNVYVTATTGFLIGELVAIMNSSNVIQEFVMVDDIVAGNYLIATDNLGATYSTSYKAVLVHRDLKDFYYEDLDWTEELHIKIDNMDTSNTLTLALNSIGEVSDES